MNTPPPLPPDRPASAAEPLLRKAGAQSPASDAKAAAGLADHSKRAWKRRLAVAFSVVLPGTGHLMHRRWITGAAFMGVFASCFLTAVTLFLIGAWEYYSMASDVNLLEGDKLERLPEVFRTKWLIGLAIVGGVTWLVALIDLGRVSRAPPPRADNPTIRGHCGGREH